MKKMLACALLASTTLIFAMNRDSNTDKSLATITAAILKQQLTDSHLSNLDSETAKHVLDYQTAARGFTLLHLAASTGYKDGMNLLASHGADPLLKDNEGKTAQDLFEEQQKRSLRCFAFPLRETHDQEQKPSDDHQSTLETPARQPEISVLYRPNSVIDLNNANSYEGWHRQHSQYQDYATSIR